jgi:hypothetical protein
MFYIDLREFTNDPHYFGYNAKLYFVYFSLLETYTESN